MVLRSGPSTAFALSLATGVLLVGPGFTPSVARAQPPPVVLPVPGAGSEPAARAITPDAPASGTPDTRASGTPDAPSPDTPVASPLSPGRRALATGAALVPGLLVHGSGHYAAGRTSTGHRLLATEGIGAGLLVGGIAGLAVTGASRRVVAPLALLSVAGAALFVTSALADLYGVLAPPGGTGEPLRVLPWVEAEAGLRYIHDPQFAYRLLSVQAVDARLGAWRLAPSAWVALDDSNARLRFEVAYRLAGPLPRGYARPRDGSYLELEGAATHHDYGDEGFAMSAGELSLRGRLDLRRVSPELRGSFVEGSAGAALESYRYKHLATEGNDALLARFGFGFYVSSPLAPHGEVVAFYDHRRDGYPGGLRVSGIGAGYLGSVGLRSRFYLTERWGLLAEAQLGSALVTGLSILFREGAQR